MATLTLHQNNRAETLHPISDGSVSDQIALTLDAWGEGVNDATWEQDWYSITDNEGALMAVLLPINSDRDSLAATVQVIRFHGRCGAADGWSGFSKANVYTTRYILDSDGNYDRSEVVKLV